MSSDPTPFPSEGDRTAWLERHQSWLRLLARHEIHERWAAKFDASDVVQQAMLEAWKGWGQLHATDDPARRAWLRKILSRQLARLVRTHQGTAKRDVSRELSIDQSLLDTSIRLDGLLVAKEPSPSQVADVKEQSLRLADVLEQLPEDYRQVILLRNIDELPHEEIAVRMNRSVKAVRMLWLRALAMLTERMREA